MFEVVEDMQESLAIPERVCPVCRAMFSGVRPENAVETPRQQSWEQLQEAARAGCYICRWIVHMDRHNTSGKRYGKFNSCYQIEFAGDDITYWSFVRIKRDGGYDLLLGFLPIMGTDVSFLDHGLHSQETKRHHPFGEPSDYPSSAFQLGDCMISEDARKWIDECKMYHQQCRIPNRTFRPTRLVEIISSNRVKLILSANLPPNVEVNYVAFSHCWGNTKRLELKRENASQLFTGFDTEVLPRTYKHAIAICVQLQYRFIWIDSLCIFQDSRSDWQHEATMMGSVYAKADLNLCAASAADSSEDIFPHRDQNLLTPLDITSRWTGEEERRLRIVPIDLFYADVSLSPLRKRAWVTQEWYLSKRSLILGSMQAWWQCHGKLACETVPNGLTDDIGVMKYWKADADPMKELGEALADYGRVHSSWQSVTAMYANTALTREDDRLMAFSGIAQAFRASHKMTERYVAGFWRGFLPGSLAWANTGRRTTTTRSKTYKAPSWSWLSLDGPYELIMPTDVNDLEQCSVENLWLHYVDDSHDTGLLRGGAIQLRGHLIGPAIRDSDGHLSEDFVIDTYCEGFEDGDRVEYWAGGDRVMLKIMLDEKDSNHVAIVSYLDDLTLGHYQHGLIDGTTRKSMPFEHADGLIYLLHTYSQIDRESESGVVQGIILYQPPHQLGVFHRIGRYAILSSDRKLGRLRTLGDRYPACSVLIL